MFAGAAPASAAFFVSQYGGQVFTSGAGPFEWSFESSHEYGSKYGGVAYRFVSQGERFNAGGWHRCLDGLRTVSVSNLAEGTYWMEITDDESIAWITREGQLYGPQCRTEEYPGLFSISYDSLTVAAPHAEEPGKPAQPPPQGPTTTAPTVSGPNSPGVSGQNRPTVSPPLSPLRCPSGYTWARISSYATCLHQGGSCSLHHRLQYRRYHFACVRKGRHYKLVRRP
jgi:hypothetical protein